MSDVFALPSDRVYEALETSKRGLTEKQAAERLAKHGPNRIPEVKGTPLVLKFLANFYHTFALLLWFSGILAFIAGMPELGWAIISVIIINAVFSFWQEFKAERATEALKKLMPPVARVMRSGEIIEIPAEELVPGDVLVLSEGDTISADARVAEEYELQLNMATLTGESLPCRRTAEPLLGKGLTITEIPNLVFSGTSIASGSGRAVVFATGMATQFGQIAYLTQTVREELSPLQKEVKRVALIVAALAIILGVILFAVNSLVAKLGLAASAMFAIGLICANVPEGLLPTLSLALAVAVQRMVKEHSLVKRLSSVETLGSTTVICTDKTGTLTQNEMTVRKIFLSNQEFAVTGIGYRPKGQFLLAGKPLAAEHHRERLSHLMHAAVLCNNARLLPPSHTRDAWSIVGDPTEAALLVAAQKAGFKAQSVAADFPRIYELPFESLRKRMTTIHRIRGQGARVKRHVIAFTKGAPLEVLALCTHIQVDGHRRRLTAKDREEILKENDAFAREALRVLALAHRELPEDSRKYAVDEVEKDLTFIGLMAMMDPPRPEVAEAVARCQQAGIRIIMVTGDYGLTAESIARRVGIVSGRSVRLVTGSELDAMPDEDLAKLLGGQTLFARVSPEHKLRIASILEEKGETVAMTGDGVNDAPALKRADIGVAMGITGTDVAKEAGDMILTDDNFASIVKAVEFGRIVFENIKKFVVYIFAHLGPEAVPFIAFVLFRLPLPISPIQILAIDLGTETLPALALGVEAGEPDIMSQPPRTKKEGLLSTAVLLRAYLYFGLIESALVMAGYFFVLYSAGWHWGTQVPIGSPLQLKASTMCFLGIVATQVGTVFACRTNRASVFKIGLFSNTWVLWGIVFETLVTIALLYALPLQRFFGMYPLGLREWAFVAFFPFVIFLADEARKFFVRRSGVVPS